MRIERLESRSLLSGGPDSGGITVNAGTLNLAGTTPIFIKSSTLVLNNNIVHKPGETIDAGGVKVSVTSRGTLVIEGTTFNDSISVTTNKKSYTIDVFGTPAFFFSRSEIKRIRIEGGAGKDTLSFSGTHIDIPVTLLGGDGNDTIRSSPGTTLIGGDGDDNLSAAGVQSIVFRSSDRGFVYNIDSVHSRDFIYDGRLAPASTGVWTEFGTGLVLGSSDTDTGSLIEGGNGNDTITASAGPDTINGGRGSDAITRTVFNDAVIPIDDDISPGDTVTSIEAFKVNTVNTSGQVAIVNGAITVHTPQ